MNVHLLVKPPPNLFVPQPESDKCMKVEVAVAPIPGFPEPIGAHAIAWSYLLDYIFADAYHAKVEHLHIILPSDSLRPAVELRAAFSRQPHQVYGSAYALLTQGGEPGEEARRIYRLCLGSLAPRRLRRKEVPLKERALEQTIYLYTLQARLLGIPIRLGKLLGLPQWTDRAFVAMRRRFASKRPVPSFYKLETWY